jgi:hypothetical protein
LAKIRNAGAKEAIGDILVTIDADSVMSSNMLAAIDEALETGDYIGGGVRIVPERKTFAVNLTYFAIRVGLYLTGLSGGLYWCHLSDFRAIGGFSEGMIFAEDLDFALRLKGRGKKAGKRFCTLKGSRIVTSCRKFDRFGDWLLFKAALLHLRDFWKGLHGTPSAFLDSYFYDFDD